jgi:hypothetical protein
VLNDDCIGISYSYRLDTATALAFIGQFGDKQSGGGVATESADQSRLATHEDAKGDKKEDSKKGGKKERNQKEGGKNGGKTGQGKHAKRDR